RDAGLRGHGARPQLPLELFEVELERARQVLLETLGADLLEDELPHDLRIGLTGEVELAAVLVIARVAPAEGRLQGAQDRVARDAPGRQQRAVDVEEKEPVPVRRGHAHHSLFLAAFPAAGRSYSNRAACHARMSIIAFFQ